MSWISPKTITGDAATGSHYFKRGDIHDAFWAEVVKGNHILFTAPRRVGKTSVMKYLAQYCPGNTACIYEDIEGVKSKNEFYKRLYSIILRCVSKSQKARSFIKKWFAQCGIEEISVSGVIKFTGKEVDYEDSLRALIPALAEANIHTVIFLDEFAEVVHKLPQQDAKDILHTLRELRTNEDFKHFTIVFAGSIGLQFVVKGIDRPKIINDLHPIEVGALLPGEGAQLLAQLTDGVSIQLSAEATQFLLQTINHLLPYYIQLMLEEIDLLAKQTAQPNITNAMITEAFERVVRKNKNFDDWLDRLKQYHPKNFAFINQLLKHAAHKGSISIHEIYNTAADEKYNHTDDYMDFVDNLVNDGYLVESTPQVYRFVSPFLQKFWLKKFPVYHG